MNRASLFQPIRPRRLYEAIVHQIQELVAERHLQPGDRLPSERELAELLNVSRASVREALRVLAALGLVEVRSGDGTFVREPPAPVDPAVWSRLSERTFLLDLLEARRIVEREVVVLAVRRATVEDVEQLQELVERRAAELAGGRRDLEGDLRFHEQLAEATRNPVLASLVRTLSEMWLLSREAAGRAPGSPQKAHRFHEAILEALQRRDEQAAWEAMERHMDDMRQEIEQGT
ncbi:MAG: FadR/GntR family transcriptional regulator [Armatimonadota bacterium]|nr:FadR/GntR family transcriptional regulator [Armatimonadota bacterium]MDR7439923.1 FadR/GntR family transcriptional regulator [Armatimonadota bacterium]MDR7562506.1 FadR/GntR family transcriptional regulator [Armatimonadota bacterium]MDR7566795.1 FadR/GntR family transcriptional regulator [Armatimonadota bacterium]MDR7601390.1 FadR/GntR family transcriptional regulator [Armatimonadota bacterium]